MCLWPIGYRINQMEASVKIYGAWGNFNSCWKYDFCFEIYSNFQFLQGSLKISPFS